MLIRLLNCVRSLNALTEFKIYWLQAFSKVSFLGGAVEFSKEGQWEAWQDAAPALRVSQAETRLAVYRLL